MHKLINRLSDLEKKLVLSSYLKTEFEILEFLEKYKMFSSNVIVEYLEKEYGIKCVDAIGVKIFTSDVSNKYNVLTVKSEDKNLILVPFSKVLDSSELALIEMYYGLDDVEIVYITPYRYKELLGKVEYDYYIMIKVLVVDCIKRGVSNLHIEAYKTQQGELKFPILYRINSELIETNIFKLDALSSQDLIYALVGMLTQSKSQDITTEEGLTASSTSFLDDSGIQLRIAANKVEFGLHCMIRIQTLKNITRSLEDTGFDEVVIKSMRKQSRSCSGGILFTGAKDTGKTTSAYAMLKEYMSKRKKLISFETPIEAVMPFPQINYQDTPYILEKGISLSKKQDIDLAFVNEIPNKEVAFSVKDLINSSIGVITTLHINRIWHLPYKLYEYYGDSYKDIISQLKAVYNQKMFNILCPHCKTQMLSGDVSDEYYRDFLKKHNIEKVFVSSGCSHCIDERTGRYGHVIGIGQPYCEFIEFDDELRSSLLRCNNLWEMELIIKEEVTSHNRNLEYFIKKGITEGKLSLHCIEQFL